MLRGEHIRRKVYASCLGILKQLAACTFGFRGFKDENTLRRGISTKKKRNKLK